MAKIEQAMTEIDLLLWEWQTAMDMMSFIGQDIPMVVYKSEDYDPVEIMTVKRVPLVKYEGSERIIIGMADVDLDSGVVKAEVNEEHAGILAIPGSAYSIVDEDPPVLDQPKIRAELQKLIGRDLYKNPYANDFKRDLLTHLSDDEYYQALNMPDGEFIQRFYPKEK